MSNHSDLLAVAWDELQRWQSVQTEGHPTVEDVEREIRARLVAHALGEAGDPKPAAEYWRRLGYASEPVLPDGGRVHWCGAFVLAELRALDLCRCQWIQGRGFVFRLKRIHGTLAQPGDVICQTAAPWHHALWVFPSLGLSIDGNTGAAPGTVSVCQKSPTDVKWATYTIEPLVLTLAAYSMPEPEP